MYMYFAARNMSNDDTSFCGHLDKRSRTMSGAATETSAAATTATSSVNATAMADVRVDESLESRSMLVYGVESMKKMKRANVFLSGLSGLGVEIGKEK
jgi:hypothetical protein